MTNVLWKSMTAGMKSAHGKVNWKIGKWKKVSGEIIICKRGFHASPRIIDAINYVNLEVLAQVEVAGESHDEDDKQVWSEMKIVKAYHWKKEDSVALAIYAAELVIDNFEKAFPEDHRPRRAIESAKKWLENPTKENESAAWSAADSAAWSAADSAADSAAGSAWSARSADSAAWSAESAAWSAAWSAGSAAGSAWSARSAAGSAAWSARSVRSARSAEYQKTLNKIEKWLLKRVKTLEEYQEND